MRRPWVIPLVCLVVGLAAGFGACYVWSMPKPPADHFEVRTLEQGFRDSIRKKTVKVNTRTGETWVMDIPSGRWIKSQ